MAGATRIQAQSESPNAHPTHGLSGVPEACRYSEPQRQSFRGRDAVSRLSADVELTHISEHDTLQQQLHSAASEIDALGYHVNDIISTTNRLEGLGLQRLDISLPKIIVLGQQSTGKSSVIEAISGIKTPRSAGTCTRCPIFVKLETPPDSRQTWTARVSLRYHYQYDGKVGRTTERRFPGWFLAQEPRTVEFMNTTDPSKLEDIIGRAQQAVVSPMRDYTEFTATSITHLAKDHRCNFSPNIVCISIFHADLPALSFYDLPGIIGQADESSDVKFVKSLVTDYIKDPEALVLVTCSMENDIANSMAGGIARELKAIDRCIGVLTKPDRLTPAARQEVMHDVFEQNKLSFGHGYFVVRNLDQEQLNQALTHQDARRQELDFFANEEPFTTNFQSHHMRFGTYNLQSFLACQLAEQTTKKLPAIHDKINTRLSTIEDSLQQYPEPPSHNASRIIFDTVLEFSQNVRQQIEGGYPYIDWRNNWKALQRDFFGSLVSLKPTMATSGKGDKGLFLASLNTTDGRSMKEPFVITDGESEDYMDDDVHMSEVPETPQKKRKMESTPCPSPMKTFKSRLGIDGCESTIPDFGEMRTKFQLDEIALHLENTSQSRVPGRIENRVTDEMMLKTLEHWRLPTKEFFSQLEESLHARIKVIFDKHFAKWEGTALYNAAWKIVIEMLELNLHQQRTTMADESLADETDHPYIFHADIFNRDKEVTLEYYQQARFKARWWIYKREREIRTGKPITLPEETRLKRDEKLMNLLNQEPYSSELTVAAEVTTYYMIAARRFHDSICMRIESKFFKRLRTQLRDELENGLGIHDEVEGHRNAIRLLAEQSDRERQRQELLAQRNALLQGKQVLHELQQKKYNNTTSSRVSSVDAVSSARHSPVGVETPTSEGMDEEM